MEEVTDGNRCFQVFRCPHRELWMTQLSGLDGPYQGSERLEKKKPVICAVTSHQCVDQFPLNTIGAGFWVFAVGSREMWSNSL